MQRRPALHAMPAVKNATIVSRDISTDEANKFVTPKSPVVSNLNLETSRSSATTSLLELATLRLDLGLLVFVGTF